MANEKNIDTLIAEDTQRRTPFRRIFDRLEGYMGPTKDRWSEDYEEPFELRGLGGLLSQLEEENPEELAKMGGKPPMRMTPREMAPPEPRDLFQMVRDWWNDKRKPQFMGNAPMNEVNKQVTGKEIY